MEVHHQRVLGAFGPVRTTSPISKFAPCGTPTSLPSPFVAKIVLQ